MSSLFISRPNPFLVLHLITQLPNWNWLVPKNTYFIFLNNGSLLARRDIVDVKIATIIGEPLHVEEGGVFLLATLETVDVKLLAFLKSSVMIVMWFNIILYCTNVNMLSNWLQYRYFLHFDVALQIAYYSVLDDVQ